MRQGILAIASSVARSSVSRATYSAARTIPSAQRSFSASSSALKKGGSRRRAVEEEFEDEDAMEAEEEEDLFGGAASDAALSPSDRAAQRTEMVRQIAQTSRLYPRERKQEAPAIRKGTLRKIVQRSESAEELEGLKDVLRAWRVLGKNVTEMAANEIIAQSCKAGRADLALELAEDRIQYGLPSLSHSAQIRLHRALLDAAEPPARMPTLDDAEHVSPALAVLRIALHAKVGGAAAGAQQSAAGSAGSAASGLPGAAGDELKSLMEVLDTEHHASQKDREYVTDAMKMLEAAGPQWARAGRRIQEAQTSS